MFDDFGIRHFFDNQEEFLLLKKTISHSNNIVEEPDRAEEYGDFQTNKNLAKSVIKFLKKKNTKPQIIVEPTCGKGSFIIAALEIFQNVKKIIGVEIYKSYIWEAKFNIIQFYLIKPTDTKPIIEIYHYNVFDFDFKNIAEENSKDEILIIGNPPWVTNSKLSCLNSNNIPKKSNFKKYNGFDAITGKGNFDIGEYIILMMFDAFQNSNGYFTFLIKNSVIKNILFDQKQRNYNISDLQKFTIDSKKEFNVSVEAAMLFCKLNTIPEFTCTEFDFYYQSKAKSQFGWVENKFVSNIEYYDNCGDIDGVCPFEWRQGIKHDLSSIMELERVNGLYVNGLNQNISLEEDLIYGVLKSSDLKQAVIDKTRKFTIITQKKVDQDTAFIKREFPKTYSYLHNNKSKFNLRKSNIYSNKPDYSIFGIGDYSFMPFKVSISGLYKSYSFSLILPQNGKPIMLDDTCYMLGFDNLEFAAYTLILLNSNKTKELLQSITFPDAKRIFTKDILMRIDLYKFALQFSIIQIQQELDRLNGKYNLEIKPDMWDEFMNAMKPIFKERQMSIFV